MAEYKLHELRKVQAETCKVFGNPTRLLILETIWDRDVSYGELMEATGLDKVTLTQHTTIMRRKGILKARRSGGNLVFSVANRKVLEAFRLMRDVVIEKIKGDNDLLDALTE